MSSQKMHLNKNGTGNDSKSCSLNVLYDILQTVKRNLVSLF
jgi:hypothetical protein